MYSPRLNFLIINRLLELNSHPEKKIMFPCSRHHKPNPYFTILQNLKMLLFRPRFNLMLLVLGTSQATSNPVTLNFVKMQVFCATWPLTSWNLLLLSSFLSLLRSFCFWERVTYHSPSQICLLCSSLCLCEHLCMCVCGAMRDCWCLGACLHGHATGALLLDICE